ncbi:MAG: NAD(+) kinase [Gammaproteobacteria bacterium]|nr:NAD(+) kinase [Gammaproteobacteria bacterium]MBL6998629.1 NAD(+) kinase [Gammaproteobacteria bacterium]
MLKTSFKTIGLIIRQDSFEHQAEISTICQSLSAYGKLLIHFMGEQVDCANHPVVTINQIGEQADLAVSVGGDGTLLTAARRLVDYATPLVGINLGRLGFLADVTMAGLDRQLGEIFEGIYNVEKRFLLEGQIHMQDAEPVSYIALNDIILHSHQSISMIEFEVFTDDQLINKQRADGLIVSTPTGSTAYALSGGGPIMHPTLDTVALVPICPHTLSNRPIVLHASQQIEIRLSQPDMVAQISFDGITRAIIKYGDRVKISRYAKEITLLHPADYDYFNILRAKLKWSNQP